MMGGHNMNFVAIAAFLLANFVAIRRPGFALALVISMFAVKQLVQAGNPWLGQTAVGSFTINAVVLTSAMASIALRTSRTGREQTSAVNLPWVATVALFMWSIVTCLWTPYTDAFSAVTTGAPYFVLGVMVAPFLIRNWSEASDFHISMLWIGIPTALMILISPDFSMKYGRLGIDIGAARSNPLALGEFGGIVVLAAVTIRKPGSVLLLARIAALLLGTALAIRSGSRGQFLYAVAIAMAFYPLAAPVRNPRVLVATVLGIAIIAIAASQLMDLLLDDPFEAKRFTFEEMAYGKSSASGRVTNVITLYKEWLSKPTAPIVGLGYGAFAYFSESAGEPYSHVLFADAVFELGLPGAAFMIVFVWTSTGAAIAVIRSSKDAPAQRAIAAMLVAWYTYELLLVNKQGALWGVASFFPAGVVMARLMTRDQAEEPDGHPSGELEIGVVECQHDSAVLETHGPSRG
jgi:hypothetical protein